jgi:hypothetical protein
VTSAEYLAFIEDKGYERPELWLSEGFARAKSNGWRAPLYRFHDTKAKTSVAIGGAPAHPGLPRELL